MKMDEEEKLIPRNYQIELMKIAIKQNTIIYLPTGSGKTFIAILVLRHLGDDLLRSYSQGGKITSILVNSVPLVDQHMKYVEDHTIFKPGGFSGEMNLDFWKKEQWEEQLDKYQVIVMTCQIMHNLLSNGFIDLNRINLMIFDECHHGVIDHPMRGVMKQFQNCQNPPRVLGLTATLLNGNCKLSKVMDEVRNLEITYNSKVATVNGLEEVIGFSTNPQEKFTISKTSYPTDLERTVIDRLTKIVETLTNIKIENSDENVNMLTNNLKLLTPVDVLKELRNLIKDLIFHIELFGTFGGYKACVAYMIQIERIKKHCQETLIFIILNYVMTKLGWAKTVFKKAMHNYSLHDQLFKFSSDKVIKLFKILKEYKSESREELCCLIFVARKFTAKTLNLILQSLKESDEEFQYLKSNFVVGNNGNPFNDTRETLFISKKNREIINSFINKDINVLVSSSVLEEGVDIPKCTLVIRFDKSTEYRSYIQSKGRARHRESLFYTIVEQNEAQKFFSKYEEFKKVEEHLNMFLIGKNLERYNPTETELQTMYNEEDIPPYYVNGPNSAHVSMSSAISLLCRYCSSLARDQYTIHSPEWYLDDSSHDKNVRVVILLPVECSILEPIIGPFMRNKKDAKRAAALVACIKLHKSKELNDDLLPIKRELDEEDVSYLFQHWPQIKEKEAGNKKKKRLHEKQIATCIKGKIEPNKPLYLHVINLNPTYCKNDEISTVSSFYQSSLCFGLVSPKPLPDLCKFPIFDSQGSIEVDIKTNCKVITVSTKEMMQLREFHYLIFNDLLEILQQFLIFDNSGNNAEMLLVVPIQVQNDFSIDYKIIQEHKTLKNKLEPTSSERINLQVSNETYLHKIASPWYRAQPTMYVITEVCTEKNPLSTFPNDHYPNFVSYYEEKHGLKILNLSQPLLLVKGLSQKLNCLKPRGREAQKKKEKRYEELQEYLVPELVIKQEFPSCLWIQARFLPSILSRVTYLLKLQQLQIQIAQDIGAKKQYYQNCPPLKLDCHLLNYIPNDGKLISEAENLGIYNGGNLLKETPGTSLTQQYNKDFAIKMLESEYCWKNIEEPKDIERDINVTVMDIEYYETFINQKTSHESRLLKNESPLKIWNLPAITYDRKFEFKNLQILQIKFNNQSPNLCSYYEALTAAEANDIVNLERLETLGDTFLKLIASLYIIFKFPNYNEGKCTTLKSKLVSNKNLYYLAIRKDFGGILKNNDLSPNNEWVPPCFCIPQTLNSVIRNGEYSINTLFNCYVTSDEQISGNLTKKTLNEIVQEPLTTDEDNAYPSMCNFINKQYVSDKTISDTVEALLGAHFLEGGIIGGIKFLEWIEILPASENVQNLIQHSQINPVISNRATNENILFHIPQWRDLENRLGYSFKNPAFLLQALTHASYSPNRITHSYERLEFIGDAILDFLITCYIYEHCGYLEPGQVTDLRSALVNNNTFASLVVRCGFHKFLLMLNSKLQKQVDKFADYLATKNYVIDDEVLILLEEEDLNIAEYVDVPKVLGDIFEALAGAVYLDSNKDINTVWRVFYKIMWQEIDLFSKNVPKNVIRRLYECHTAYPQFSAGHETENNKTMVSLRFMCEGRKKIVHGFGTNKTMAKRAAAKIALRALKI